MLPAFPQRTTASLALDLSSIWGSVVLTLGAPTPDLCHLNLSQHHSPRRLQSLLMCHVLGQLVGCLRTEALLSPCPFIDKGPARSCRRGSLPLLPAHSSRVSLPSLTPLPSWSSPQHRASESQQLVNPSCVKCSSRLIITLTTEMSVI